MESTTPPQAEPIVLQKPPGYRDPTTAKPPPPRKPPVLPPSFRPPKSKRRVCCCICCCTFCIILVVLFIAGGIIYIIYKPSIPEFHLGSFRVPKSNITNTPEGAYLDADTSTRIEVKNRNGKMTWHFEQSSVRVWADNGDLNLGSTKVSGGGFVVKERDMTELTAETKVRRLALDERQRRRLKGMIDSKALMPSVEVRTRTGFGVRGWKSMMLGVTLVCGGGDFTIRQIENGAMPLCSLTLFNSD